MAGERPTIYDVAQRAGVSKSLVSLVVRGSDRVSDESRAAVEAAIRDLGYRPNRAAADLAARRTRVVGVLIDDYANPWFIELMRGLDHVLSPAGFRLTLADAATVAGGEDPVEALLSMRVDGIVVARDMPDALLDAPALPPLVVAGARDRVPADVDVIAADDAEGARLAAGHLVALGHRALAHLSVAGGVGAVRRAAFVEAAEAAGARVVVTDYSGPATEDAGYEGALRVIDEHPDVTAIFAANDVMALGALGAARERGLVVPTRLSVIGYDNTALARTRLVSLTSVDGDGFGVGREAARVLLARMTGHSPPARRRRLAPRLVVRSTTAEVSASL